MNILFVASVAVVTADPPERRKLYRTIPQASLEFEVEDAAAVEAGATELAEKGFDLLHPTRTEPWGQTITRLLSAEGLIIGISFAPGLHG